MAPRLWKSVLPVALLATGAMQAAAQERPADLTEVPPVPTDYTPGKTAWGDWDFTGTWPTERITEGRILFQRPPQYGDRAWVTDEEFARRIEAAKASDGNFAPAAKTGIATAGTAGLEDWFRSSRMGMPNYIKASRAYRRNLAAGIVEAITPETDDRSRFVNQFDWDPGLGPRPAPSRP